MSGTTATRKRRPARRKAQDAALTVPVFPLWGIRPDGRCACRRPSCEASPGKHPKALWRRSPVSSRAHESVEAYLESNPSVQGVGARMGEGILCLDFDPRDEGLHSLGQLERDYTDLPDTAIALTGIYEGERGEHRYYLYDSSTLIRSRPLSKLLDGRYRGIDVKAEGGYVVLPPTPHLTGVRYEWEKPLTEIADAPAWLLDILATEAASRPEVEDRAEGGLRRRRGGRPSREVQEWVHGPDGIPHPQWEKLARITAALWDDTEADLSPEEIASLIYRALVRSSDYDPSRPWSLAERNKDVRRILSHEASR